MYQFLFITYAGSAFPSNPIVFSNPEGTVFAVILSTIIQSSWLDDESSFENAQSTLSLGRNCTKSENEAGRQYESVIYFQTIRTLPLGDISVWRASNKGNHEQ